MQRLAVTNQLPDMYFPGYHLLGELARSLAQRDQIVDLAPFLDAEPAEWKAENYTDSMLGLGTVDGVKYGMAFNASLPIIYINETLVEKAGVDPKDIPSTWDGSSPRRGRSARRTASTASATGTTTGRTTGSGSSCCARRGPSSSIRRPARRASTTRTDSRR